MEALQMLKFSLKQQRLNFIEGWAVTEDELVDDVDDTADLLEHLTSGIDRDNVDKVIHALGQDCKGNLMIRTRGSDTCKGNPKLVL
jgi:hypothetical protein